jgi:hypothetical protein
MNKMRTCVKDVSLLSLVAWSILSMTGAATAQTDSATAINLPQQYSATAIGQAGTIAGKTFGVNVYLTGLTSDEQRQELLATLKSKGQDGVVSAMEKLPDLGRVSPVGSVGSGFRYVRAHKTPDGGMQVTMATNRPISFGELYNFTRSSQYPIGMVTLNVDKDGNGTGLLYGACKVKFNKKGELEVENFGQKPWRLANVRLQK